MKLVSVFIPTYNGEEYIYDCLKAVFEQKLPKGWDIEVLVTDSSSTDRTVEIVKSFPKVNLEVIPKSEFSHGKTRNDGAHKAKGEFIAYLTQDAIPSSSRWLSYMIEPFFINPDVVGVVGKQIPRSRASETIRREVTSVFSSLGADHSISLHRLNNLFDNTLAKPNAIGFMSDVNSAYRRSYIIKHQFKNVDYAEDQMMGDHIVNKHKLIKAYTPFGSVIHSNDYGPFEYFYRKVDERIGLYKSLGIDQQIGKKRFFKDLVFGLLADAKFTILDKGASLSKKIVSLLLYNFLYNLSACRARYIPMQKLISDKSLSLESRRSQEKK